MSKYIKKENSLNKYVTVSDISSIMTKCGLDLKVNNLGIYQTAFIHRSYMRVSGVSGPVTSTDVPLQDSCNETYEFLGDTILNSIVGTYLYDRYYDQNEGFLTKTRTKMVRGTTLGEIAKRLGLDEFVIISQHVESEGGRSNIRILEDLLESFIAAIYLDNGSETLSNDWFKNMNEYNTLSMAQAKFEAKAKVDPENIKKYIDNNKRLRVVTDNLFKARNNGYLYCQKFVMNVYEKYIDIVKLIAHDDNYKDRLQHYYQQTEGIFPTWYVIKEEGKTNNRWHTIGVKDRHGYLIGVGRERKKTDAEQLASKNALIHLGIIEDEPIDSYFK